MARWVNSLRWLAGGLCALAGTGITGQAIAQDGALTELYGYGVHRFYAGDYNEAQRVLNMVIDAGVEDPRPHYFRGLVTYHMGMQDAAKADFEHAADLEARGKGVVNIGAALQRVQGPVRRDIEMARMMARVTVAQEQRANKQLQAEQARANPDLAKPPESADAMPPALSGDAPAAPATPPASPDAQSDPFKDDAVPAPAAPATPAPAEADPFAPVSPAAPAAPAAPAPAAPVEDPFGTAPAAPAAPAAEPANPFGT